MAIRIIMYDMTDDCFRELEIYIPKSLAMKQFLSISEHHQLTFDHRVLPLQDPSTRPLKISYKDINHSST